MFHRVATQAPILIAVVLGGACGQNQPPLPSVVSLSDLREQMHDLRLSCQPEQRQTLGADTFVSQSCVSLAGTADPVAVDLSFQPEVMTSPKYYGITCGVNPVIFGANFSVSAPKGLITQIKRATGGNLACSDH